MKTGISKFASLLMMLAFAVCMTMSFASCGGDGEEEVESDPAKEIVGTWYKTLKSGATYEMTFTADGGGSHKNSDGTVHGTLKWQITSPGHIHCKKWYYNDGHVSSGEFTWYYRVEGDNLWLSGEKYTRK